MSQSDDNAKDIIQIKSDIKSIKDNHLAHIEVDMNRIRRTVEKLDTRLWAFGAIVLVALIGNMFS